MPVGIIITLLVLVSAIALSGREIAISRHKEETYYCGLCGRMMPLSHFPH